MSSSSAADIPENQCNRKTSETLSVIVESVFWGCWRSTALIITCIRLILCRRGVRVCQESPARVEFDLQFGVKETNLSGSDDHGRGTECDVRWLPGGFDRDRLLW